MERRIGERHPVEPAVVRWRSAVAPRGLVARLRAPAAGEVILENLSVTGAGFVGPVDNGFTMNMRLEVEIGGRWGLVQLVRIRPTSAAGHRYYGVAFLTQEPLFMEQVAKILNVGPLTDWSWR